MAVFQWFGMKMRSMYFINILFIYLFIHRVQRFQTHLYWHKSSSSVMAVHCIFCIVTLLYTCNKCVLYPIKDISDMFAFFAMNRVNDRIFRWHLDFLFQSMHWLFLFLEILNKYDIFYSIIDFCVSIRIYFDFWWKWTGGNVIELFVSSYVCSVVRTQLTHAPQAIDAKYFCNIKFVLVVKIV